MLFNGRATGGLFLHMQMHRERNKTFIRLSFMGNYKPVELVVPPPPIEIKD
jgi:hypothetical protein